MIGVEKSSRSSFEHVKEEVVEKNRKSLSRIGDTFEGRIVEEDVVEDIGKEAERELVEVVEEV